MTAVRLSIEQWTVGLLTEPSYTEGSASNTRRYSKEHFFGCEGFDPSSSHGLIVEENGREVSSTLLKACGGGTRVHSNSLAASGLCCFVAVGDYIASFEVPSLELAWSLKADIATCFGVYFHEPSGSLLVHGELAISRVDLAGNILWQFSGRDIFSEGFSVARDQVQAIDFNHERYVVDILSGTGGLESDPSR